MKHSLLWFALFIAPGSVIAQETHTYSTQVHPKTWRFNSGFDVGAWWGGTGVTPLEPKTDALVQSHLMHQTAYSGDIYLEWLRKKNKPGSVGPGFGIKTKATWDWFTASNGGDGNGQESLTLNYVNVPLLFEYCLSFKNKVTRPSYTAPTSYTSAYVFDHGDYYHIIYNTTSTPGHYNPGGVPYTDAIFVYAGPQICYLAKGFHSLNGTESVDTDPALTKSYAGFIAGFCFYLANLNVDISYQRGLTSICTGKSVYVSGCLFRLGFNLTRRKF